MDYQQVSEYNENRLAMIISNCGPSDIFLSTAFQDVSPPSPIGICVASCERLELTWQTHGEMCWQIWYVNCSTSQILYWEWFGTSQIDPCVLTPSRSKFDTEPCRPDRLVRVKRPVISRPKIDQRILIGRLLENVSCKQ